MLLLPSRARWRTTAWASTPTGLCFLYICVQGLDELWARSFWREVFGADCPPISATKSLTGHSLGAAGVQEAIYSLLMMQDDFIAASAHIEELDPDFANMPIVQETRENAGLNCILSNSFGFGGTNGSLVMKRV